MPATPTYALPYPLPSAPVAAGADDIHALADRLEIVLPTLTPGAAQAGARVTRAATQSIPNATQFAISFTVVSSDHGPMWAAGQPTRLTVKDPGTYIVTGCFQYPPLGGGAYRSVALRVGGSTVIAETHLLLSASIVATGQATTVIDLVAGQYVELCVYQDSGAAVNCNVGTAFPVLSMARV
jgi:hypothetical protein